MLLCYHLRARPGLMYQACGLFGYGAPWQVPHRLCPNTPPRRAISDIFRLAGHLLVLLQEGWRMLLCLGWPHSLFPNVSTRLHIHTQQLTVVGG